MWAHSIWSLLSCDTALHLQVQEGATGRPEPPTARDSSNIDKHSNVRPIPLFVMDLWNVLHVVGFDLETSFCNHTSPKTNQARTTPIISKGSIGNTT